MRKILGSIFAAALFVVFATAAVKAEIFTAYLTGAQEVPAVATNGSGYARVNVNEAAGTLTFTVVYNNMTSAQTLSHIHAPAAIGATVGVAIDFGTVGGTSGTISGTRSITPTQLAQLRAGLGYVNVHSSNFPAGELRGQLARPRPVDYDGDGRMDLSNLRFPTVSPPGVAQITYHNLNSTTGYTQEPWGDANTDFPAPGDYDGDGKGDFAIYRAGATAGAQSEFWILNSGNGTAVRHFFGLNGDSAVSRDYDGDGRTDMAVYRRGAAATAQAVWYINQTTTNTVRIFPFGTTGNGTNAFDSPVPADYDGDGKFDIAVYRFGLAPANNFIYEQSSNGAITYRAFCNFQSDYILPGDYDGDGKADFMCGNTGAAATTPMRWTVLRSSDGAVTIRQWGVSSDLPVQGDYDGDGRADLAIFRRGATATSPGTYWIINSLSGTGIGTNWGLAGDFPVGNFDAR